MGLQAFVEAFFYLAGRRFKSLALKAQVLSLLELCEAQLEPQLGIEDRRSASCSRALPRAVKPQSVGVTNPLLSSPAPLRRAASQDYRLHQRLKARTLRSNVENWRERASTSHPTPKLPLAFSTGAGKWGVHLSPETHAKGGVWGMMGAERWTSLTPAGWLEGELFWAWLLFLQRRKTSTGGIEVEIEQDWCISSSPPGVIIRNQCGPVRRRIWLL